MSDIEVVVSGFDSTDVSVSETGVTNVNIGIGLPPHASTHYLSGVDPINHNSISGLQGGSNNEYYHLTAEQYDTVTGVGDHVGSSTFLQFSQNIPSGIEETGILFGQTFSSIPSIQLSLETPYEYTYLFAAKDITTTGFTASFSDLIDNTGFNLQILATNFKGS